MNWWDSAVSPVTEKVMKKINKKTFLTDKIVSLKILYLHNFT